jgi:hypothetical protein
MLKTVKQYRRKLVRRIGFLWAYTVLAWNDQDWDHVNLAIVLRFKLGRMADHLFGKDGVADWEVEEKFRVAKKALLRSIEILDDIIKDEGGFSERQARWQEIGYLLGQHATCWWD